MEDPLSLDDLRAQMQKCVRCDLRASCTQVVPGDGPANAKILILGEAPGADEDIAGRPFVGRAGRLLRDTLEKNGLQDKHYFVMHTCQCKPPENRTPTPEEIEACWPWVSATLKLVRPKIVVTLGKPALFTVAQKFGFAKKLGQLPIMKLAGKPVYLEDRHFYVFPTLHPTYALRQNEARQDFQDHLKYLAKALPTWLLRP